MLSWQASPSQVVGASLQVWILPNVTTMRMHWGQPLRVECYAAGSPVPGPVRWSNDGEELVAEGPRYAAHGNTIVTLEHLSMIQRSWGGSDPSVLVSR